MDVALGHEKERLRLTLECYGLNSQNLTYQMLPLCSSSFCTDAEKQKGMRGLDSILILLSLGKLQTFIIHEQYDFLHLINKILSSYPEIIFKMIKVFSIFFPLKISNKCFLYVILS